ncbi:MAG: DUF3500 domain-containing protein [Dehalococcoidia bacterium]
MSDELRARMTEAAVRLLDSLDDDQRALAQRPLEDREDRETWFYTPTDHGGLTFHQMSPKQQEHTHRLVATGYSRGGYVTAATIIGLDNVLAAHEDFLDIFPNLPRPRDPQAYYIRVFGDPRRGLPWGWRFGGHHISVNYLLHDDGIRPLPAFVGADPAESRAVGPQVLRPLGAEEDLGRELLHLLDRKQRGRAVISPVAPRDIVTSNHPVIEERSRPKPTINTFRGLPAPDRQDFWNGVDRRVVDWLGYGPAHEAALEYTSAPRGLPVAELDGGQRDTFVALLRQYVDRMPPAIAEAELARVLALPPAEVAFAWAGGAERGQPHYYRIQGPNILIEYDNTQRDVNHIHTVWRDPEGDFGRDLLAEHYAQTPHA